LRYFLTCIIIFIFIGCAPKIQYTSSQAFFIVIKNSKIAIADVGFIKKNKDNLNLQIFSASTPIFELIVSDDICIDSLCMDKKSFNAEFFEKVHYETFITELLNFQPIYDEKNIIKTDKGFSQNIKTESFDIKYKVENETLYFKDKKNKILIKLRKL